MYGVHYMFVLTAVCILQGVSSSLCGVQADPCLQLVLKRLSYSPSLVIYQHVFVVFENVCM